MYYCGSILCTYTGYCMWGLTPVPSLLDIYFCGVLLLVRPGRSMETNFGKTSSILIKNLVWENIWEKQICHDYAIKVAIQLWTTELSKYKWLTNYIIMMNIVWLVGAWYPHVAHEKLLLLHRALPCSILELQTHEWESSIVLTGHTCDTQRIVQLLCSCHPTQSYKNIARLHQGQYTSDVIHSQPSEL